MQQIGAPATYNLWISTGTLRLRHSAGGARKEADVKKLLGLAVALALAAVLISTKPTSREIASAVTGQTNYVVFNKEKAPPGFTEAAVMAVLARSLQEVLSGGASGGPLSAQWRSTDFVFLTYSNLSLAGEGSLKCLWLLRNGFCAYFSG